MSNKKKILNVVNNVLKKSQEIIENFAQQVEALNQETHHNIPKSLQEEIKTKTKQLLDGEHFETEIGILLEVKANVFVWAPPTGNWAQSRIEMDFKDEKGDYVDDTLALDNVKVSSSVRQMDMKLREFQTYLCKVKKEYKINNEKFNQFMLAIQRERTKDN